MVPNGTACGFAAVSGAAIILPGLSDSETSPNPCKFDVNSTNFRLAAFSTAG